MKITMSTQEFINNCPTMWVETPMNIRKMLLADRKYIVKIDTEKNCAEFGYPEDDWAIE